MKPISMGDVRLAAGEGQLSAHDVLAAVNGILASRRRSLTAALSCPDGFRLVPVEPTQEMVETGERVLAHEVFDGWQYTLPDNAIQLIYRALLAASPSPAVDGNAGWRPIESAPKAGTIVLGTWSDTWPDHPHVEAVYCCEGKWFYAYDGDTHHRAPTHWQPLPSAPSQDAPPPRSLSKKD